MTPDDTNSRQSARINAKSHVLTPYRALSLFPDHSAPFLAHDAKGDFILILAEFNIAHPNLTPIRRFHAV